jgi:hypothetical protein
MADPAAADVQDGYVILARLREALGIKPIQTTKSGTGCQGENKKTPLLRGCPAVSVAGTNMKSTNGSEQQLYLRYLTARVPLTVLGPSQLHRLCGTQSAGSHKRRNHPTHHNVESLPA